MLRVFCSGGLQDHPIYRRDACATGEAGFQNRFSPTMSLRHECRAPGHYANAPIVNVANTFASQTHEPFGKNFPALMGHQDTYYRNNEEYAEFLSGWDLNFYGKYSDTLKPDKPDGKALDVGCGVGQVVHRLDKEGIEAHGVDISGPNITKAKEFCERCQLYDGRKLPFPDNHFDSVGSLNVLEHVDEPEAFLADLVRVTKPGGKVVVSSPNFFRAIGLGDYHYRMRGLGNKWRNLSRVLEKRRQMKSTPDEVRFDRMKAIVKEPFEPDDDAVVLTNLLEIRFFLERNGCVTEKAQCTDRYVFKPLEVLLNLTPARYVMLCAFVVGRKKS